jgi:hypothetical protein
MEVPSMKAQKLQYLCMGCPSDVRDPRGMDYNTWVTASIRIGLCSTMPPDHIQGAAILPGHL